MKVRVRNFQTAKDSSVEIKGFTVIVGKSNSGKTSILRAVEASIFNDSITGCVRYGEKDAVVDVELDNFSYTWEKGETKNGYSVTTPNGTKEYSKVGFQRPDEFEDAGFREFRIDGEQYPIRPQFAEWHSPIFLLNKTGKVVTELMASVTRLDVINMSIRKCSTNLRRDRSTLKVREDDLKKMKRRSHEYDVLDDIETSKINGLYSDCLLLEAEVISVGTYATKLEALQASLAQFKVVGDVVVPPTIPSSYQARIRDVAGYISKLDPLQASLEGLLVLDTLGVPLPIPKADQKKIWDLLDFMVRIGAHEHSLSLMGTLDTIDVPTIVPIDLLSDVKQVGKWEQSYDTLSTSLKASEVLSAVVVPTNDLKAAYTAVVTVEGFLASLLKCGRDVATVKAEIQELDASLLVDETAVALLRNQIQECPVCGRADHV